MIVFYYMYYKGTTDFRYVLDRDMLAVKVGEII